MTAGESDLRVLLRDMRPALRPSVYIFAAWPGEQPLPDVSIEMTFRETEGLTLIVEEQEARACGLPCIFRAAWITLEVHSNLNAIGFLAAVTHELTEARISCNVVSGVYHDHLFVPADRGEVALEVLKRLAAIG